MKNETLFNLFVGLAIALIVIVALALAVAEIIAKVHFVLKYW